MLLVSGGYRESSKLYDFVRKILQKEKNFIFERKEFYKNMEQKKKSKKYVYFMAIINAQFILKLWIFPVQNFLIKFTKINVFKEENMLLRMSDVL